MRSIRLIALFTLMFLLLWLAKLYLVPILSDVPFSMLLAMPMADIMKISEFATVFILLGSFLFYEILHAAKHFSDEGPENTTPKSPFRDVFYLFVVVFGSGGLYALIAPYLPY